MLLGGVISALNYPFLTVAKSLCNKPLLIVFPFSNVSFGIARNLFDLYFRKIWPCPILTEFKPGAGGIIGTQYAKQHSLIEPTLLVASATISTINYLLHPEANLGERTYWKPVSLLYSEPLALVSTPKFASSYKGAIDLIKKNPNKFNYGSVGKGSSIHLLMLLLLKQLNLEMVHIPYKSNGLQVALMSGEIDLCFTTLEFAEAYQASGMMKILACTSERRLESYPDIPTLAEYIPNFSIDFNLGMLASENTPASQIQEVNNTINQILVNPEFQKSCNLPGLNLAKPHPPSYYGEVLNKELQFWSALIARIGKENIT